MNKSVTIDELKNIIALKDLPDEHLKWILDHSDYEEHEAGDIIYKTDDPIDVMSILLEEKNVALFISDKRMPEMPDGQAGTDHKLRLFS